MLVIRLYENQPGQRVRHLHTSEVFRALVVSHDHGQIQTAARDVRERPPGVERQRGENWEHGLKEIRVHRGPFFLR